MSESVEEIVARTEARFDKKYAGLMMDAADLRLLIASWRERGEALKEIADESRPYPCHENLSSEECLMGEIDCLRMIARAALAGTPPPSVDAVEAENRACEAIMREHAQPNRFKPHESWKEGMSVAEVYETAAIDVSLWGADAIAARRKP
jgi:hypothetical protein